MKETGEYKRTIFWRGLGLVLVPLLFGLAILLGLNQAWQESIRIAQEESRQNILLRQTDDLMNSLEWRMSSSLSQMKRPDPNFVSNGDYKSQLEAKLATLKGKVQDSPHKLEQMAQIEKNVLAEAQALTEFPSLLPDDLNVQTSNQLAKTAMKMAVYHTAIRKVFENEYDDLRSMRARQDLAIERLVWIVKLAALAGVLICWALVYAFSRSFSKRLEALSKKAERLSEHQVLTVDLKGDDELSYLDKVFARTSERLLEAAEHRRSILSMVAHDMRSPLMAAGLSIDMIDKMSEETTEPHCEETAEAHCETLQHAAESLSGIVEHLNQILARQKAGENEVESPQRNNSTQLQAVGSTDIKNNLVHAAISFVSRPQIFQKSLLLVIIPMLIQALLMIEIQRQLQSINQITRMERMYGNINIINKLLRNDLVRGTSLTLAYSLTGAEKCKKRADSIFAQTDELFNQIRTEANGHKEWLNAIDEAHAYRIQQIAGLQKLYPGDSPAAIGAVLFNAGTLRDRPIDRPHSLSRSEIMAGGFAMEIRQEQMKLRAARAQLDQTIVISMAINVLLAIVALFIFSKSISGRLKLLIQNATELSNNKTMQNTISGHDEIAYLGLVLFNSQVQLERASEERLEMMNSVAEEMRSPLKYTSTCLAEFRQKTSETMQPVIARQLNRAEMNINRVTLLIDDLLGMETLESGKIAISISEFDLHEMADTAISAVASLAKEKEIELENSCDDIQMCADRDRIIQVLVNLLSNAIKFSPANTRIRVTNENSKEAIKISVIDQGAGMDEETRTKVFEKYFQAQTPEKKQGFGLGLAICSLIVQTHSGKLGVESEVGKGSIFWFSIPKQV